MKKDEEMNVKEVEPTKENKEDDKIEGNKILFQEEEIQEVYLSYLTLFFLTIFE